MLKRHFRRGVLSLAALGGSVNASCANFHPGPVALTPDVAGPAPRELWQTRAGRTIGAPVALADGAIYAAGVDRVVHAITLDSGRVRWGFRLTGAVFGGVVRADSSVYVASVRPEGNVLALRAADGRKRWSVKVGATSAPLALVHGLLLVPTREGRLLALSPLNGMTYWRRTIGYARSAATPAGAALAIATLDSMFLFRTDGRVLQRRAAPGAMLTGWTEVGPLLVGATTDSLVLAVRASDLSTVWSSRVDAPVLASPAVSGDTLFVATRVGTVYRVDLATGEATRIAALDWPLTSGPVPFGGLLLVGGADGTVRALDRAGHNAWRLAVWRPVDVPPIDAGGGRLLVIGGDGDFHLYGP